MKVTKLRLSGLIAFSGYALMSPLIAQEEEADDDIDWVSDFYPRGNEVPLGTDISITFRESMNVASIADHIVVGIRGLEGYPVDTGEIDNSDLWREVTGSWTSRSGGSVFTFTPGAGQAFVPGQLVMCEVGAGVESVLGVGYSPAEREVHSFIIDNGVNYEVVETQYSSVAVVDNAVGTSYGSRRGYNEIPLVRGTSTSCVVISDDEHCLEMYTAIPQRTDGTKSPVMFWVHGGGWAGGRSGDLNSSVIRSAHAADYLSRKLGVAVVGVSWRSNRSRGDFCRVLYDINAAIDKVISMAIANDLDTTRMGLYGGSAGTPTSSLVAQHRDDIMCYIGYNGLYDLNVSAEEGLKGRFGFGTRFGQNIPSFSSNSAAENVRSPNPANTLLLHGNADTTILLKQSTEFADAINAVPGGEALTLVYDGEPHAFFNKGRRMQEPTLYWTSKHLIRVFGLNVPVD